MSDHPLAVPHPFLPPPLGGKKAFRAEEVLGRE